MNNRIIYIIAFLAVFISLATWVMDLTGMVEHCIYCRCERTIIGLLGFIMLLPTTFIIRILSYALGFFGATVASQQIFLVIMKHTIDSELILAVCALIFIILQIVLITLKKTF